MNILTLDIGNTTAHLARVQNGEIEQESRILTTELESRFSEVLKEFSGVTHLAYCSVVPTYNEFVEVSSRAAGLNVYNLNSYTCPIPIDYPNPGEIGQDRLANAIGASNIAPLPSIVIDMGTATTFDIVSLKKGYVGGVIAPGLSLMREYLHEKTALLPEIRYRKAPWPSSTIGKSTLQAMESGGIVGSSGMIKEILSHIREDLLKQEPDSPPASLLLTGGKAPFLEKVLGADCEYHPNLTLQGLEIACQQSFR